MVGIRFNLPITKVQLAPIVEQTLKEVQSHQMAKSPVDTGEFKAAWEVNANRLWNQAEHAPYAARYMGSGSLSTRQITKRLQTRIVDELRGN